MKDFLTALGVLLIALGVVKLGIALYLKAKR